MFPSHQPPIESIFSPWILLGWNKTRKRPLLAALKSQQDEIQEAAATLVAAMEICICCSFVK